MLLIDKYKKLAASHLGDLRETAEKKGLSYRVLEEMTGLGYSNIHRILNGKYIPRYDNYLKLRDAIEGKA